MKAITKLRVSTIALVALVAVSGCKSKGNSAAHGGSAASGSAGSGSAASGSAGTASNPGGGKTAQGSLRVGIAIPSFVHAVAWIAADGDHLARAGLARTSVQVMGGSAATMRALIGKSIDVGIAGGDAVLKATRAGAKLVVIGGLVDKFYHRVVGRKGVASMAALEGKRIGLPFLGGPQDMAVKVALAKAKLAYGKDVRVVSLGKEFNRMAALAKGEIDATTSQTPPTQLAKLGLHVLADLPAQQERFPYAVIVARRADLAPRARDLRAMLAGLCKAVLFYKDPKNRAASLAVIAKHIGGSDAKGASAERYRVSGPSLLSFPPEPSRAAFATVLRYLGGGAAKNPALSYDKIVDLSLLAALKKDGGACALAAGMPAAGTPGAARDSAKGSKGSAKGSAK